MITVYVGDVTEDLALTAIASDINAKLIEDNNWKNLANGTYYTSIGDLSNIMYFLNVLYQADIIIYCPPLDKWSDQNKNNVSVMKQQTERYIQNFYTVKSVEGLSPRSKINQSLALALADTRKVIDKQIWVAGCSISHGVGVTPLQRYGQLIADSLKLPVSFLTKGGSSIQWAADQILRSDIKGGDIIIWGLTGSARIPYFTNKEIIHVTQGTFIKNSEFNNVVNIDTLDSLNTIYHNVTSIFQVINFCQKLNVKLIIAGIFDEDLPTYLINEKCFIMLYGIMGNLNNLFLDIGDDDLHPGPLTHQFYANKILEKLHDKT